MKTANTDTNYIHYPNEVVIGAAIFSATILGVPDSAYVGTYNAAIIGRVSGTTQNPVRVYGESHVYTGYAGGTAPLCELGFMPIGSTQQATGMTNIISTSTQMAIATTGRAVFQNANTQTMFLVTQDGYIVAKHQPKDSTYGRVDVIAKAMYLNE